MKKKQTEYIVEEYFVSKNEEERKHNINEKMYKIIKDAEFKDIYINNTII
jgi:hypothetical protein